MPGGRDDLATLAQNSLPDGHDQELRRFGHLNQRADERTELIVPPPSFVQRGAIWFIAVMLLVTLFILFMGKVSVVIPASGQIVPERAMRMVQALEGGVVSRVAVQAGDRLKKGDVILSLDVPENGISYDELRRKTDTQRDQLASLVASADMLDALLNDSAADSHHVMATATALQAANAFNNARMRLDSARQETAALTERRRLLERQMDLVRENLRNAEKTQESLRRSLAGQETSVDEKGKQLNALRGLAGKKLLSPFELANEEDKFRTAEEALSLARQRLDQQDVEIGNQRLKLSELQTQINMETATRQRDLREAEAQTQQAIAAVQQERVSLASHIGDLRNEMAIADARLSVANNRLLLSNVTAPVAGILAELKVTSPGGLIGPGTPVATILPESEPFSVLVSVANRDIGLIHPGTMAQIKVDAFPFQQYGTLPAEVTRVLPNVTSGNTFPVRLRLLKLTLSNGSSQVSLFPGLNVQAELTTTRQRLITLLFDSRGGQ